MDIAKAKVLVVDDIAANRKAMRTLLKHVDVEIHEAENGFDAMSMALSHEYALILLDVNMPEIDGFEVCDQLRDNPETECTPVIFVSAALREDEHRILGYLSGATDYITKPIHESILVAKIKVFLRMYDQQQQLIQMNARLAELAGTDDLTGLTNRRGFFSAAEAELARSDRHQLDFCLAILDIDHFKKINDRYGHQVGDSVLVRYSAHIRKKLRGSDLFARLGGEEFAILFPQTTREGAYRKTCVLLDEVAAIRFTADTKAFTATISAGVSQRKKGEALEALISRVDALLYEAKGTGRNRVASDYAPQDDK